MQSSVIYLLSPFFLPFSFSLPPSLLLPPLSPLSHYSDPNTYGMTRVNRSVGGDISLRLQNLQLVVNSILHFYLTSQQQLVLAPLPDISAIAHSPDSGNQSLYQYSTFIICIQVSSPSPIIVTHYNICTCPLPTFVGLD